MRARRTRSRWRRVLRVVSVVVGLGAFGFVAASLWPAGAVAPGSGVIVYSDGATYAPWVRDWNGSGWSAPYASSDVHEWRVSAGAASRTRDEIITLGVNIHNDIRGMVWNGTGWTEFPFGTLDVVNESFWWSQAVAYERLSDDAVMVWANGSDSATPLSYRVWNGTSWTAEATITVPFIGKARQMRLAASPDSDEMVLVVSDDDSRDYAFVWNGSSWGNGVTFSPYDATIKATPGLVSHWRLGLATTAGSAPDSWGSNHGTPSGGFTPQVEGGIFGDADTAAQFNGSTGIVNVGNDPSLQLDSGTVEVWFKTGNAGGGYRTLVAKEAVYYLGFKDSTLGVYDDGSASWRSSGVKPNDNNWHHVVMTYTSGVINGTKIYLDGVLVLTTTITALDQLHPTTIGGTAWSGGAEYFTGAIDDVAIYDTILSPTTITAHHRAGNATGDDRTDVAVAYEQQSGHAVVAYGWGSSSLYHRVWNGSSWSSAGVTAIPSPATGNVRWTTLAADPGSDRIALGVTTFDADTWLAVWDGSAFGSQVVATQSAPGTTFPSVAVAFESRSGQALALYGVGSTSLRQREWTGVSWSAEEIGFSVGDIPNTIVVDSDPYSNQIMATVQDDASDLSASMWSGTGWGAVTQLEDDTNEIKNQSWIYLWGRFDLPPSLLTTGIYLDQFNAVAYNGSDGTANWSPTPWDEIGTAADDPVGGNITVLFDGWCVSTGCLRFESTTSNRELTRRIDLAAAAVAELSFDYRRVNVTSCSTQVRVRSGAASPWTTLATYGPNGGSTALQTATFDISSYASSTTEIGFLMQGCSGGQYFYADNVAVNADGFALANHTNAEGDAVSFPMRADDPGGDSLTFSATGLPAGLSIDPSSGAISGTIAQTAAVGSPHAVQVTVTDPGGNSDSAGFVWTVTEVNVAPELKDLGDQSSSEGSTVSFTWIAGDADLDTLTWSAASLPPGLSIDPSSGLISGTIDYTAAAGSPYSFTVRVVDDGSPSMSSEITRQWTVLNVNRAAAIDHPGHQTNAEGDFVSILVTATDPDGDGFSWSATGLPPGLSIDPVSGLVSGTLTYDAAAGSPYSTVISTQDSGVPSAGASAFVTWTVTDTNRPPLVTSPGDQAGAEGGAVSVPVIGSDPDGDGLVWSATGLPGGLSIDPGTGLISGTPDYSSEGIHPVFVRATDDGVPVEFSEVSFTWTVTNTNRAPLVTDPGDQSHAENDSVSLGVVGSDPDGDALTWSASGLPSGLAIDPGSGVISGTLDFLSSVGSPYAVTVRTTDDDVASLFTEVSFSWTVTDLNRAPVVTSPGDLSSSENDPVTFAISGSDPDGDTLTWSASGLPAGLSMDPATGVISGTITFDASPSSPYSVVVRATDDGLPPAYDEVAFTWTVGNTNRAPVVTNPGNQTDSEGAVVSLSLTGGDADGDALAWSATGLPAGLAIDSASGVISGTLSFTSAGSHAVVVRLTDDYPSPLFVEASFTWTVSNTNRTPVVADPGDQTGAEGSVVGLAIVGSDPDGDGVTWSAVGLPSGLSIDPASGTISGTLPYDSAGSYPVTVRVTDDGSPVLFTEAAFVFDVANTNRAPVVTNPGARSNAETDTAFVPVVGSDPDGDSLTWSASGLPSGLSIDPSSGQMSGSLPYDAAGTYLVTVRATDDDVESLFTEVSFTWTVANTNRAPVVTNPGATSHAEAALINLVVAGSDPDGDTLTWSVSGLPPGLSIDPASGTISGTLSYVSAGSHTVTVRATDDDVASLFTEVSFTWTVSNTNRAPVVTNPGAQTRPEGVTVLQFLSGSDPDGDTLAWSAAGLPAGLAIDPVSGQISGVLPYDAAGTYPVTVRATDDDVASLFTQVSFTWTVTNTNRAPVVTNPGARFNAEASAVNLQVVGSDPDGNGLAWSASGLPPGLSISPTTGVISGTVSFEAAGVHSVVVRATDDDAAPLFSEVSFSWTVSNTNRAPIVADPGDQFSAEGTSVSVTIAASDPDGNLFGFEADGLPPGLSMDPVTGVISGDLGFDLGSSYAVVVSVTDSGSPPIGTQMGFTWSIGEVNRPPVIAPIANRSGEAQDPLAFNVTATDPDDNGLVFSAAGLPSGVTIGASSGVVSGTPTQSGSFSVTVTVTDTGVPPLSDETEFSWTLVSPPGFPTIGSISNQRSMTGDVVSLVPSGVHPDGLALRWSAVGLPPGLSIDRSSGVISGITEAAGLFDVVVSLTDSRDQAVAASFSWRVTDPDLPPVATADTVRTALDALVGGSVAIDVIGNDVDPEGTTLVLVSAGEPEVGAVRIVDGLVLFDPPNGWLGTTSFTYVVSDAAGNESVGTVTVTIEEALGTRIAAAALQWDPAAPAAPNLNGVGITSGAGTELLLGTVFQSLYVLRVPLALLGGAVFWSLLLGGVLNLGFVLKGGLPAVVRRTSRHVAVVMVSHGDRLEVLDAPRTGSPIWRYTATERGLEATGRRSDERDGTWAEVSTPNGHGWVPLANLTEEVDRIGFADDPEPLALVREFATRLRVRRDFSDLVSVHGLAIAHHGPVLRLAPELVPTLMEATTVHTWKGRNPAYPDQLATFDTAIATSILDAWDHPQRELVHDTPTVPSTVIPVEFTNYHMISIGADVHGPDRLDQHAWLIAITHEAGRPRIAGLIKEG